MAVLSLDRLSKRFGRTVTADDLWRHLPGARSTSVHLERFPAVDGFTDRDLMSDWEQLIHVRETVQRALEARRQEKVIGNSLGARVMLSATGPLGALLERYRADLPMLFIVSDVALTVGQADVETELRVDVEKAPGVKCERCWRFVASTHTEPDWLGICDRCVEALAEPVNR